MQGIIFTNDIINMHDVLWCDRYNKVCGLITSVVSKLKLLKPEDSFRITITEQLLDKLYHKLLIHQFITMYNVQCA